VKLVLARKHIKRPYHQRHVTDLARLVAADKRKSIPERLNILAYQMSRLGSFLHFILQVLDVLIVLLQRVTNRLLEMVDSDKIGEKRQNVFDSYQVALLQELHRLLYIVFTANHVLR
jgi:hypothetical protein